MKFLCTQENLNNGLSSVGRIAAKSASLPILNNILFKAVPGGLELTATNLEVAVTTTIRGKVEGEGSITIQSRLITEVVALLPNEKVELEVEETTLNITCGKSRTIIKGTTAEDFPVIPQVGGGKEISLPTSELAEAINRVSFAVNPDESRPEIGGVFLGKINKKIVLVGTDSYRLAESTLSVKAEDLQIDGVIIPLRAAQEVGRISQDTETAEVVIVLGENQILWKIGETKVVSRLVSGQYPDYLQIVPKEFNTTILVGRDTIQQAVRAASLFVRSGINDVRLMADPGAKAVKISSTNSQLGENTTELEAEVKGEAAEAVFNYRYLLDGLAALSGKEVRVRVAGPNSPSLFEPKSGEGYRYLIMPIRQ